MHWLEQEVSRLAALAETSRPSFRETLRQVVAEVARRPGVTGCFACHDGLVIDAAGSAPDYEALSAMTQCSVLSARDAAAALSLGGLRQLVIVGAEHKLALFAIDQVVVAILSPV